MSVAQRCFLMILLAAIGVGLGACGTVRGVGQDVQDTGRAIKRAAS